MAIDTLGRFGKNAVYYLPYILGDAKLDFFFLFFFGIS